MYSPKTFNNIRRLYQSNNTQKRGMCSFGHTNTKITKTIKIKFTRMSQIKINVLELIKKKIDQAQVKDTIAKLLMNEFCSKEFKVFKIV